MSSVAPVPTPAPARLRPQSPAQIRLALEEVAGRFSARARDTILLENAGKHLLELALILRALPDGGRILDLGGGLGVDLLALKALRGEAVEATLVDRFAEYTPANRMGEAARGLALMGEAGIRTLSLDLWPDPALPLPAGGCDVVTCFDLVEHLPGHPLALLREARRLLRPGGRFLLSGPNAISLMKHLHLLAGRHPYMPFERWISDDYTAHFREYTRAEYVRLLLAAGFHDVRASMVAEPERTRARCRYHEGRHAVLSPVALALWASYLAVLCVPRLRPTIYVTARAASDGA